MRAVGCEVRMLLFGDVGFFERIERVVSERLGFVCRRIRVKCNATSTSFNCKRYTMRKQG